MTTPTLPTLPTLPEDDLDAPGRAATLREARDAYTYDYTYRGLCFTGELPKSESFDAPYIEQSLKASAALRADRGAGNVADMAASLRHPDSLAELTASLRNAKDTGRIGSIAEYEGMFRGLKRPAALDVWDADWAFAWQRVAGAVPTLLQRADVVPAHFPVTQAHFAAALGERASLEAARAAGRLFLCDFARFDGIPCGVYPPDGDAPVRKHLHAPLALFCATEDRGLLPVAIQCHQRPGPDNPVYTPADGARWRLAKAVVQVADANLEGIVVHFAYTHMILERFILAARRQLSSRHPILALLAPHFRYTLAANAYARKDLVTPNGTQERVLAPRLEATHAVLRESLREVTFDDLDPAIAAQRAGVDDPLLEHPFRDDQRTVAAPVRRWVEGYVALYYAADDDVRRDVELRAMVDEVGSPDGGRLPRLVAGARLETRADVVELCARIIHRASTYHAAINYAWYDWMAFAPNMAAAASIPMPPPGVPVDMSTFLDMMPPRGLCWEQLTQVFSVDSIHVNFLGEVPPGHFVDPRVAPLLERLRAELREAEAEIEARNTQRRLPYIALLPSRTTASINS
jgi:arachidonate 15-lipoxygenase